MSEKPFDKLDECFAQIVADRDKVIQFYDVRFVFASYCEILGSLIAAMLHNNIYTPEQMAALMTDFVTNALTRKSTTTCQRTLGEDVIQGSKQ
jgi:hypothetical protein